MAGRYSGSYLDQSNDWRIVAIPADIGQASLVERIPTNRISQTSGTKALGGDWGRRSRVLRNLQFVEVGLGVPSYLPAQIDII